MPKTGFTVTNSTYGMTNTDLGDIYVPVEYFLEGGLWNWGYGFYGQLGNNSSASRSSPVQTIAGGTNWKQVSMGITDDHNVGAIKTDGTLWLWGINNFGQLGNNAGGMFISSSSPVQTVTGGTNWKQVSLGGSHTAAIKTDGTLWLWGANTAGSLGDNSITHKSSPVQTVAGGTNWKQVSCMKQSYSTDDIVYTAAIKTDGTLWMWGDNTYGILGDNTTVKKSSPVQTVAGGTNWKQVSCGYGLTAAIKTDGSLWLWGRNLVGGLGDNTTVDKSSPVQTVAGGTNWKQVEAVYNVGAVKTDGTLWMWGGGAFGGLGDNTEIAKSSPVQTVAGGSNWKQVSVGLGLTGAVKTDGTLWMWGNNADGALGDNTRTNRSSPVQTVAGGTYWKQVSVGYSTTAAVTYDYWW
jgi:alpha-tubulin suppressor-like RCC1 family protein